ncbi:glycoside hydrolase family 127 protein [Nonomuraea sp. 3N208]|uniref:glycoside hydrolase family 127 protein n=1 Tax=Nonomuraea sp. 3N208 TaxID=3457421 RepID=UPI003FD158A4
MLRPLTARLSPHGVLGAWQQRNAEATIPHCITQLEASGVLDNFRRVVGESGAAYRGFVFADSDLYKVIEAVAWEIGRSGTNRWDAWLDEVIGLVGRVQDSTGYVMTWIQGVHPEKRFAELEWTHEMYVLGHLIQAAVALDRAAGRDDLLRIARRFTDLLHRHFGPGREEGVCGHPEIETALVELYRHTGEERDLTLAQRMIDLRGLGLLKTGHFGAQYFQDHLPVRQARTAVGHAVRQLYLNAGVTDLYLETGEKELLEVQRAQWENVHQRKMYITGAYGSRHRDEAFGDDYELPSDRAYAETCASIADLHWSWRMLLATGESRYADVIEREIHNAIAASVDASGTRFFYSNPLQLRPDRYDEENAPRERAAWYACACCPPNVTRLVAQFGAYVASEGDDEVRIHQYADADIDLPAHLGEGVLEMRTDYPSSGTVELSVRGRLAPGVRLALRIPDWSRGTLTPDEDGYLRVDPRTGFRLELDVRPRWTRAHPRVDALRGCVALERGPIVYCVEQSSLPEGVAIEDLVIDVTVPPGPELTGHRIEAPAGLYQASGRVPTSTALAVPAVPFATWGNTGSRAMRVWLPANDL